MFWRIWRWRFLERILGAWTRWGKISFNTIFPKKNFPQKWVWIFSSSGDLQGVDFFRLKTFFFNIAIEILIKWPRILVGKRFFSWIFKETNIFLIGHWEFTKNRKKIFWRRIRKEFFGSFFFAICKFFCSFYLNNFGLNG